MIWSGNDRNAETLRAQRIHSSTHSAISASPCFKTIASEPLGMLIDFHEVKLVGGLNRIVNSFKEAPWSGVEMIETQRR
jgi:hypothetical protein